MPKMLHISIAIELPEDEWEEARQKVALHPLYTEFRDAINAAGIKFADKLDTSIVRPKRSDAGRPRARKPRLVTPPQDAA